MVNQTQISAAPLPHTRPTRSPRFEALDSTKSIPKSPTPVPVCSSNAAVKMSYCKPDRTSMEPVRMNPEAQSSLTPSQAKSAPNVRRARTHHCKVNLSSVFFYTIAETGKPLLTHHCICCIKAAPVPSWCSARGGGHYHRLDIIFVRN